MVKISYDPEGDLLEARFTSLGKERRGIGLTDQITLFCTPDLKRPLGLTIAAYTRLLAHPRLPLSELDNAPQEIQRSIRALLERPPLSHFIHLEGDTLRLADLRISELAGMPA